MKYFICLLMLCCGFNYAHGQALPTWFTNAFHQQKLDVRYELKAYIKPAFLLDDFNGDNAKDVAILIAEKKTGNKGILIMHANNKGYYIFGAGINNTDGGKDFKWVNIWRLYTSKKASHTAFDKDGDIKGVQIDRLEHHAIIIWQTQDGDEYAGGILYWKGNKYIWLHQGE